MPWWDVYYGKSGSQASVITVDAGSAASARKPVEAIISATYPGYSITKVTGPYASQSDAQTASNGAPGAPTPANSQLDLNPGDWPKEITHWLSQSSIWVRGVEIVAGLLLVYLGVKSAIAPNAPGPVGVVKKVAKASPTGAVATGLKKAVKK